MKLVAKTLYGLETVLANELVALGASDVKSVNRAVTFNGDRELLYKVNYCARTALSFLMPVGEFRIKSKDDLYKGGLRTEWSNFMDPDNTFSIAPVVNSAHFTHTGYAGLILKDAIADYFREKAGRRPSVNAEDPDILINLHISNDQVTISLDSSVVPLFKRGYRQEQAVAPLNEVLAAGILLMSGWNASVSLLDPMCGSGTFPIEAALIACKIPPGKFRKFYGFQKWRDYDEELFSKIRLSADEAIIKSPVKISGSDISQQAVLQAATNISKAGLSDFVSVDIADFKDIKASDDNGFLFINPPYGVRLQPEEFDSLYNMIGTTLKHNFPGYVAWMITSDKESVKNVGLKAAAKHTLFNGALECTLIKYELYRGTKKLIKQ
jgi:putative N6-adenine-specific DNA methylase